MEQIVIRDPTLILDAIPTTERHLQVFDRPELAARRLDLPAENLVRRELLESRFDFRPLVGGKFRGVAAPAMIGQGGETVGAIGPDLFA